MMAGGAGAAPPQTDHQAEFARLMYQGGKHLAMRTRVNPDQAEAVFICKTAGQFYGYEPLDKASDLLMEILVSVNGEGRREAPEFNRVGNTVRLENAGQDPALEG